MKKYNVILDTDIGNSWDDQFALVYLLKCSLFNLVGITIEPFKRSDDESIYDNENISYDEIINIGNLLGKDLSSIIYRFSDSSSIDNVIDIVNRNDITYILAIGGLTNVSNIIKRFPSIIDKIQVIWLGGNSIEYDNNNEFNLIQDLSATKYVFNSGVSMVVIPARNVAVDLMINIDDLKSHLKMDNVGCFLCDRFLNDKFYGYNESRVIWDISVVAYMINKEWFLLKDNLHLSSDLKFYLSDIKSNMSIVTKLDSFKIYDDLFFRLNN